MKHPRSPRSNVLYFQAAGTFIGLLCLLAVVYVLLFPSRTINFAGCSEWDHHDRKLPNSYRLRVLDTCVYRIKWGPDHVVLPTTGGMNGEHGILEVAIFGGTVVGPVVDSTSPTHPVVSWFWLDTNTREFKEGLTKSELSSLLQSKGLTLPASLTHVESLPDYAWGD